MVVDGKVHFCGEAHQKLQMPRFFLFCYSLTSIIVADTVVCTNPVRLLQLQQQVSAYVLGEGVISLTVSA